MNIEKQIEFDCCLTLDILGKEVQNSDVEKSIKAYRIFYAAYRNIGG